MYSSSSDTIQFITPATGTTSGVVISDGVNSYNFNQSSTAITDTKIIVVPVYALLPNPDKDYNLIEHEFDKFKSKFKDKDNYIFTLDYRKDAEFKVISLNSKQEEKIIHPSPYTIPDYTNPYVYPDYPIYGPDFIKVYDEIDDRISKINFTDDRISKINSIDDRISKINSQPTPMKGDMEWSEERLKEFSETRPLPEDFPDEWSNDPNEFAKQLNKVFKYSKSKK